MRTYLSRVEDVVQIAERGCVVSPGIPRSSETCIKIGDTIWLTRADGSETKTTVRGIETGGPIDDNGIPLLLGSELISDHIPIGTMLSTPFTPTKTLTIKAQPKSGLIDYGTLFTRTDDGHLQFGWTGRSMYPASLSDLHSGSVEFSDYIMEGGVRYHMHVSLAEGSLILTVSLHGTNRDEYIEPQICQYVRHAGCTATADSIAHETTSAILPEVLY